MWQKGESTEGYERNYKFFITLSFQNKKNKRLRQIKISDWIFYSSCYFTFISFFLRGFGVFLFRLQASAHHILRRPVFLLLVASHVRVCLGSVLLLILNSAPSISSRISFLTMLFNMPLIPSFWTLSVLVHPLTHLRNHIPTSCNLILNFAAIIV